MSLFVESSSVLPLVDLEISFPVGSLQDPVGLEGLAQLTGHAIRRGPRGLSEARFEDRLAALGARVSVEVSMRSIRVRATVLRRNLESLLELVARLIWRPAFRRTDFNKLKRQAQAALAARRDDDQTLGAIQFRESLFGSHPYGRTLSGNAASLRRIGLGDAHRFYRRHLEQGPFVVGIAGDVAEKEAEQLVCTHLPPLKPLRIDDGALGPTRARRGRHVVVVDKPDRTQTQLFIGTLGARTRDPKLFPLIVSNTAFGGTFSGPLMRQVRGVRG